MAITGRPESARNGVILELTNDSLQHAIQQQLGPTLKLVNRRSTNDSHSTMSHCLMAGTSYGAIRKGTRLERRSEDHKLHIRRC